MTAGMTANTAAAGRSLILASGSPRRIEMMQAHGYEPLVIPAQIEENVPLHHSMTDTVTYLALKKARDVEARWLGERQPDQIAAGADAVASDIAASDFPGANGQAVPDRPPVIIAADTVVCYQGEIMGKPVDKEDGFRMLSALRSDVHDVVTGVALVEAGAQHARVFYEITRVFFKDYSDEELLAYLDTDEAYDKAGGYAIQGWFSRYVDHIEGDYDNVVGFPWKRIEKELAHFI
ncbi:MAG: Maf family protein [Anaerovoracaceae bacterium]